MTEEPVVVGIDVGGPGKGFHASALRGTELLGKVVERDPEAVTDWCLRFPAQAVGIDAPCRWRATGRARLAERQLAANGINTFATPVRKAAEAHAFYGWMFNGERLYRAIEEHYRLFDGQNAVSGLVCFETFPQAVACAIAGGIVPAKRKTTMRRELLCRCGVDTRPLTTIDWVDAALCAIAADHLLRGGFEAYGDPVGGFIVVPRNAAAGRPVSSPGSDHRTDAD